jgi:multisubunit Na+/H+ antiporter MnhB subunit
MRRKLLAIIIIVVILYVMFLNSTVNNIGKPIYDYLINNTYNETGSTNIVTGIYLNYRVYDTLFEALLLIVSVIGIIYLSVHKEKFHE